MQDVFAALFVLGAGTIVYTVVGYPCVLALLARARRLTTAPPGRALRTVTVLMAVHNGGAWIARKLASLAALDYPAHLVRILVLDDGSSDETARIVRSVADPRVELVTLPRGGKAAAINAGLALARSEILFFTDVRQTLHPQSLRRIVGRFEDPRVGVVSGELVIQGADRQEATVGLYWRYEKWIRRHQSEIDAMTGATGCIYAMRRELAVPLPPAMLVDDMYLPLTAWLAGSRIVFEPEAKAYDGGTTPAEEFRRKVRTLSGNIQIVRALPGLLAGSGRPRFHFVSHKMARLVLPYAVLAVAVSSLALPSPLRGVMVGAQGLFYALAALDSFVPAAWRLKGLTSAPRTFVVLMAAAALATPAALAGRGALWRPSRIGPHGPARIPAVRAARWRRTAPVAR
jgi:cellulose synthase/poly-beta-1,6-N-acetylglucosamine synthase-like glycosyltransferase